MESGSISPHTALIYLMVTVAAADRDMTDAEMARIGETTRQLPIFEDFNQEMLVPTAQDCASLLGTEGGLDTVIELSYGALPDHILDTAYAIACEIAAADGAATQSELRILEMLRHKFEIDRLSAAAIERGVAARNRRL